MHCRPATLLVPRKQTTLIPEGIAMALLGFDELYRLADALTAPVSVVAAGGADATILEALAEAQRRRWVSPVVTGSAVEIQRLAAERRIDLDTFHLVDSDDPASAAVETVRAGRAEALMKGQIATPHLMKAILQRDAGLRTERCICQIVLMEIPRDKRKFLLADTGITVRPSLEQKADILQSLAAAATVLRRLDTAGPPHIAIMAATEKVTETMPDTLEAAELARRASAGEFRDCVVQGPLSFDLAYAAEAGAKKKLHGDVIGAADAMLFPDLLSANLSVKAIMYTADCRFGGVLCGAQAPVVFMSRADSTATRLNSLALACHLLRSSSPCGAVSPQVFA
jgi:phosphate butyryltransferase